jgi:CRP-like cAMP-binding protein
MLGSLSKDERGWLGPLKHETFKPGDVLVPAALRPEKFWFIQRGFISVSRPMLDGRAAAVGYIDCGIMPVQAVYSDEPADLDFTAQTPGEGCWAKPETIRRAAELHPLLRRGFNYAMLTTARMMAQHSACNTLHSHEQIVARRLLEMTRLAAHVPLTQEFLAEQLGFSRKHVGQICKELSAAGLVCHRRGYVEIIDREGLKARACECYAAIDAVLSRRMTVLTKRET